MTKQKPGSAPLAGLVCPLLEPIPECAVFASPIRADEAAQIILICV
jgi:hypothetical protein